MPFPAGLATITVTGLNLLGLDGSPLSGDIIFTPSGVITAVPAVALVLSGSAVAQVSAGSIAQPFVIAATDCVSPGFTYTITFRLQTPDGNQVGLAPVENVAIPSTLGAGADISALLPGAPPPVPSAFNTASTWTAAQTFTGSPPLIIPAGAAAGDVLTSDAGGHASWEPAGGISPPAGDLGGSASVPTVTGTHLASPLPLNQGGTAAGTAAGARTALGLGTAAVQDATAFDASGAATAAQSAAQAFATSAVAAETARAGIAEGLAAQKSANLSDLASAPAARTNLGLGTAAVQAATAFDAAGAASSAQSAAQAFATSAAGTETTRATAAEALAAAKSANLSDLASAATARANLGLGTAAVQPSTAFDAAGAASTEAARAVAAEALLAKKPAATDCVFFVSTSGSDSSDGLSWGSAFATVQHAVSALPANGGRVFVGSGTFTTASQIVLDGLRNVVIEGTASRTGGAGAGTILVYTGTAASFISAQNSAGCRLLGLYLEYTSASFTGNLVDARNVSGFDTAFFLMENCILAGSGVSTAGALAALDKVISSEIANCTFMNAQVAITGMSSGSYSNVIRIRGNHFGQLVTCPIVGSGQAWLIDGNTFEPLQSGAAAAYSYGTGQGGNNVTFLSNWFGDVASGSGTWITWAGNNLVVQGNYMGGSATSTGIAITGNSCFGIEITSNQFATMSKAVDLGATTGHTNFAVMFNVFTSVTTHVNATTWPTGGISYDGSSFRIGNCALTGQASGSGHGVIYDAESGSDTAISVRGGTGLYVVHSGGAERLKLDAQVTYQQAITSVTTTSSLATNPPGIVLASGAITVTLPAPSNGYKIYIKNIDAANNVTLATASGNIEGSSTLVLLPGKAAELIGNGTNWYNLTAQAPEVPVSLTDAATIAVDASLGKLFRAALTSAVGSTRVLGNPANPVDGKIIVVEVTQSSSGGNALTYGTAYAFSLSLPQPVLSATVSTTDYLEFVYNAAAGKWRCLAFNAGF